MREITIPEEPVELHKLLQLAGLVASGGEAKHVIAEGRLLLNGEVETRKRKKIVSGDVVEFDNEKMRIRLQ